MSLGPQIADISVNNQMTNFNTGPYGETRRDVFALGSGPTEEELSTLFGVHHHVDLKQFTGDVESSNFKRFLNSNQCMCGDNVM